MKQSLHNVPQSPALHDGLEPGPKTLCQIDAHTSCGACCGMYNVEGVSRRRVRSILADRTRDFAQTCADLDSDALLGYRSRREDAESHLAFSDMLKNCPFLGLLDGADARNSRVGCLLHPARHNGQDVRDCGAYGSSNTCNSYSCLPAQLLNSDEQALVLAACKGDSYLYGLILNDIPLVKEALRWVDEHAGVPLSQALGRPKFIKAMRQLFKLKVDWPWRDPELLMVGMFLPDAEHILKPLDIAGIDYEDLGCAVSRFNLFLTQFSTTLDDEDDLREAEALIWDRLSAVIEAAR